MRWSKDIENLGCQVVHYPGYFCLPDLPDFSNPLPTQLQGPSIQKVAELAGRTCYESVGKGRSTDDYFKHIVEVGHLSVGEHGHITVSVEVQIVMRSYLAWLLLNRPGLWVRVKRRASGYTNVELTVNARTVLEWPKWFRSVYEFDTTGYRIDQHVDSLLYRGLAKCMASHMPSLAAQFQAIEQQHYGDIIAAETAKTTVLCLTPDNLGMQEVTPETDEQIWISLFMQGSRGWSHEQVRHGDFTGISQRSTRFVDESDSPWIEHPLLYDYLRSDTDDPRIMELKWKLVDCQTQCRSTYDQIVSDLANNWLPSQYPDLDKTTARKQARGAARGYLGNALATNMVFSASVAEWKEILRQRGNPAADWEMRELTCCVLEELRSTPYASRFLDFRLEPEKNGMGMCVIS